MNGNPVEPEGHPNRLFVNNGICHVLFAYDLGWSIDLEGCDRKLMLTKHRHRILRQRRAPKHFDYQPPPLGITREQSPVQVLHYKTNPFVDVLMFDFGAISVRYQISIQGSFDDLLTLSYELYDHEGLLADSRNCVEQLLSIIRPAVAKPEISETVEDYTIFEIRDVSPETPPAEIAQRWRDQIAQILRSDTDHLSSQEVYDALQCRISYGLDDMAIIDWNGALLFDREPEDVRSVLEFANVELLEFRHLDDQLDSALEQAYQALIKPKSRLRLPGSAVPELKHVSRMQVDSAMLFEGINNALKLLGDHYLARVYHLAAQRQHLKDWDEIIRRKIQTLDSIYEKLANQAANLRLEVLEWIIIVLIAISILISFIPGEYLSWWA